MRAHARSDDDDVVWNVWNGTRVGNDGGVSSVLERARGGGARTRTRKRKRGKDVGDDDVERGGGDATERTGEGSVRGARTERVQD